MEDASWKRLSGCDASLAIDEHTSLVYITVSEEGASALSSIVGRIRRNIRCTDSVVFLENTCAIGLPSTPFRGAQMVARRILTLLADVDCELQVLYGHSALLLWQRLQSQQAQVVNAEEIGVESSSFDPVAESDSTNAQSMPYLAYLEDYPSRRLLHLFPYELARLYQCVPVGAEREMLTVGTSRRLDESAIAHIQAVTQKGIFQVRCEAGMIDDVLRYWQSVKDIQTALM